MLNQLKQLASTVDGRYATDSELQFVRDYIESIDLRVTTYEKVRNTEDDVIHDVFKEVNEMDPDAFNVVVGAKSVKETCIRDRKYLLKHISAAMLVADMDRLRDALLVWQRTLVKATQHERPSKYVTKAMVNVIKKRFTPEEAELLIPNVVVSQSFLS